MKDLWPKLKQIDYNPFPHVTKKRFVAALCLTAFCIASSPFLKDGLRQSTKQEAQLEAGIQAAFGKARMVRCLSEGEVSQRLNPFYYDASGVRAGPAGGAWPHVPVVWLEQRMCDGVSDFAAKKPRKYTDITFQQAFGLLSLAHELRHTAGTASERGAHCEGLQTVGHLAMGFGAAESFKYDVNDTVAAAFLKSAQEYTASGQAHVVAGYAMDTCRPGSQYDLGLLPAQNFPWPPTRVVY